MNEESSALQILQRARELSQLKKSWHFHILAPGCLLNTRKDYSLILEIPSENAFLVSYSNKKPMAAGKELVKLLHGSDVVQEAPPQVLAKSAGVEALLERVQKIHERGEFWHHHMLFPDCVFNKNKGKWSLILEDPQTKEVLESVTNAEPKEDLKQVETLFYGQQS